MKTIALKDAMTGETLEILFDLEIDKMQINGMDVERKKALESSDDEFVYGPKSMEPTKLYHLSRQQINNIKGL